MIVQAAILLESIIGFVVDNGQVFKVFVLDNLI